MSVRRIAAGVEYAGANYRGWQFQSNADSVQQRVEQALGAVAAEPIRVIAAGRTDAGVHATGQVIHFETSRRRAPRDWLRGVNTHLPADISLLWTRAVAPDFHARFSARERTYRYVICNRAVSPAWLHGRVTWWHQPLDVVPMRAAAEALVGRHDFSAFRAAACQAKSACREVRSLQIGQCGEWLWIDISADGFLHHMVRNIAGALLRIGEGRAAANWAAQLLATQDRRQAAATAPAAGLYLTKIDYEPNFKLPPPATACRFW